MKIAVAGIGYVGLAMSVLLAKHHEVWAYDINAEKVASLNNSISPIKDADIERYLKDEPLNLCGVTEPEKAFRAADYIIICTPTDYNTEHNYFDTHSVEHIISLGAQIAPDAVIVIKSTVPVGFVKEMKRKMKNDKILFSPEFLREGEALFDNLYPSRIIVGGDLCEAKGFAALLKEGASDQDIPILITDSTEAEAIKLFSNTYLAMRVAFFNELDTFAESHNLDSGLLIQGVSLDPRIGVHYNNPSFGYGGYCLPKDTKQMLANYKDIPQNLIQAIVDSNRTRKEYVAQKIIDKSPAVVGVYRLTMKRDSDNFRDSSVLDVIDIINSNNIEIVIYEPNLDAKYFRKWRVVNDLLEFKKMSDCILANRKDESLRDVYDKVYTRDLYQRD